MKPNKQMRAAIKAGIQAKKELEAERAKNKCVACNGTGHYDMFGSPKCSICNGTGVHKR